MTDTADHLYVVEIESPLEQSTIIETGLDLLGISVVTWQSEDPPLCIFREYFEDEAPARARLETVSAAITEWLPDAHDTTLRVAQVQNEDWQNAWKRFFHTERVSRRIIIKPSWETAAPAPDDIVLELDPGMSFGTGQHGTTRACLQLLDDLAASHTPCSLLDMGCGSGILSLAAARLGYQPVAAFDHDPTAVSIAQENAAQNGVQKHIDFFTSDLATLVLRKPATLVVANILAHILQANARTIVNCVADTPEARLILSGILDEQYEDIQRQFTALGFQEMRSIRIDEWRSGCFKRSERA